MKLREERVRLHRSDCAVGSISWMPDNLNDAAAHDDGWLACGNCNGIVSVTLSSVRIGEAAEVAAIDGAPETKDEERERTNFNIGSHKSQVHLVSWNLLHRKLATCSVLGAIFVYQKSQGRWNVDLINDRSLQVQEFRWSHSCQRVLIAYSDGLVVMGTVQGQRLWQRIVDLPRPPDPNAAPAPLHEWPGPHPEGAVGAGDAGRAAQGLPGGSLDELVLTCGTWSPRDRRITVGTSTGYLVTFAVQWNRLPLHLSRQSDRLLAPGIRVTQLLWSCPSYSPDIVDPAQPDDNADGEAANDSSPDNFPAEAKWLETDYSGHRLAVAFETGHIYLMDEPEDGDADLVTTGLINVKLAWSSNGQLLAVGGFVRSANLECACHVQLYTRTGQLVFTLPVFSAGKPISSLCWAHNDRRLFVAANCYIHTLCVEEEFPSLQLSTSLYLHEKLRWKRSAFEKLPLPVHLRSVVQRAGNHTIKTCLPEPHRLREFVLLPRKERLYCTVLRNDQDAETPSRYTLYLEFMGGLIPLLRARRVPGLRPDFLIYDPKIAAFRTEDEEEPFPLSSEGESSEAEEEREVIPSPPVSPLRRHRSHRHCRLNRNAIRAVDGPSDGLFYNDRLPECHRLAAVQSNVWGNRFRLLGLASFLPPLLGSVNFRKNVLRSQPREMSISVCELTPDMREKAGRLRRGLDPCPCAGDLEEEEEHPARSLLRDCVRSAPSTPVKTSGLRRKKSQIEGLLSPRRSFRRRLHRHAGPPPSPLVAEVAAPPPSDPFLRHTESSGGRGKKLKKASRIGDSCAPSPESSSEPFRYLTLHNRKPVWNENLQVYQLDFGGRVTQESTKNFQIDLDDKQILQFGRLNANTFALDFQYPFSPLQAFAVSLTNVTCRFK